MNYPSFGGHMIKKACFAVALLFAFVLVSPVRAFASGPQSPIGSDSANRQGFASVPLDFVGSIPYYIEASTPSDTPVLLGSGSGEVYDVTHDSGTAGDYCMLFDSASISGITPLTKGKSLVGAVLTSANGSTSCTGQGVCGLWKGATGRRFANGVVGIKHGSNNSNCTAGIRFDSMNQANPLTQ